MMRLFVFASALALVVASSSPDQQFELFKKKFKRHYASKEEETYRHEIFNRSLAFIEKENARGKSYTLGVTNFADLTFHEWRSQHLTGYVPSAKKSNFSVFRAPVGFVLPDSVDWTEQGAVTPVQNQAHCGSCWSFSTTGALEGASVVAGRPLIKLSEQNILDCDKGGNKCQGGSMDQAFDWVGENGLLSEDDDPYKCADQTSSECQSSTCPADGNQVLQPGDVTGHTDVDHTEGALEAAVAQQPVSVAIEADQAVFQHYTGGVLSNDACGESLDHGVLVVGYGTDNGQMYWKVKNSWGTDHGEDGYWRIERGSAELGGECGIRKGAVFPTVKGPNSQILV